MSWGPGCPPGNVLNAGVTGNSNGQTVNAGTTAFVQFNGQVTQLNFETVEDGQAVIVLFSITRSNSDAAGSGQYTLFVDGAVAPTICQSSDQEQQTLSGHIRTTIALKGSHNVSIRCTATTGNEVLTTPGQLIVLGAE